MRREGLVDYERQESDARPPRKYYELTAKGKAQLTELNDYWKEINDDQPAGTRTLGSQSKDLRI